MRWTLVVFACFVGAFATSAHAHAVYKCVARGNAVSFQDEPCGPGETTAAVRGFTPAPEVPEAIPVPARRAATRTRERRTSRATRREVSAARDACAEARARRDDWERRVGLKRTYDQLRHWNDTVSRACR